MISFTVEGLPVHSNAVSSKIRSGPKPSATNTRPGLTLNQVEVDWRAAMQSTRECSVEGCERTVSCKGMCDMHYSRVRRTGSTDPRKTYPKDAVCAIDGCGRPRKGRAWCAGHWRRWRHYGNPLGSAGVNGVDWNVKADCQVAGCANKAHAHRFCQKHLRRWEKYGDPLHVAEVRGRPLKGEYPTWAAIHKRLARSHGPARGRECVDCGNRADEWSIPRGSTC